MSRQLTWKWAEDPVGADTVQTVGATWGVALPNDYIETARQFHGGSPSERCLDFDGQEQVFGALLPLASDEEMTITDVRNAVQDRLPKGVYPFADDPADNLYCFDYRQSTAPQIVFWYHEIAESDHKNSIVPVAASFSAFLDMLRPCED